MTKKVTIAKTASGKIAAAIAEIRSRDWRRQRAGVRALAEVSSPETDLALLRLLDHRSADVRLTALEALAERGSDLARLAARAALSDSDALVRNTAAATLAAVGTRLDRRRLELAMQDEDWVVRATAADSLGIVARKAGQPALLKAMRHDSNPCVRRDAAFALSYAEDTAAVPNMESALAVETEEQARIGLLSGLYALGQSSRLTELLELLRSDDSMVRHAAVNAIRYSLRPEDRAIAILALKAVNSYDGDRGVREETGLLIAELSRDSDPTAGL